MNDPLLLPLALQAIACYDDNVVFSWEGEDNTSHILHNVIDNEHVFTFAGTMPDIKEWLLDIFTIPIPVQNVPVIGDVHAGFLIGASGGVYEYILPTLKSLGYPKYKLAGHSKGAGNAGIAYGILKSLGYCPSSMRLYEPPMFGGQDLAEFMKNDDVVWTQTYNQHYTDIITQVPFGPTWKRHVDPIRLRISDDTDIVTAHKMPAVIEAIKSL